MSEDDLPATKKVQTGGGAADLHIVEEGGTEAVDRRGSLRSVPRTTLPTPLGPYMLERRLGIGGMAEVFLARKDGPAGFSKQIVVKRILPHLAEDQRFVDMFLREAQTAAELNHTNIVQVYELGEADGQYYIAMEYVDGVTLYKLARRAWRKGRSIPMEVILRAIADAALGLHHAHTLKHVSGRKLGLVHRDISPDNLIMSRGGMTKVLDFGIAKGSESGGVTKTGELKGKIPYMSPEQIRGEELDGRSDLYSLGVTLYWLLTGQRPFDGATELMTLQGVLTNEARAPSLVNPHIPPDVDDIVLSLLEKDPQHRPSSGAELYDALIALAPLRTTESTRFVGEVIDDPDDDAPASKPLSDGFVPSTPLTTKLSSGERQVIRKTPRARRRRNRSIVAAIAGGSGALAIGALAVSLVIGDVDRSDEVTILPAAAVMSPPSAKPAAAVVENEAKDTEAAAAAAAAAAVPVAVAASREPGRDDEPAKEAAAPPAAVADDGDDEDRVQTRQKQRRPSSKRRAQVSMKSVTTRAPAGVSWSVPGGKVVGRGAGRVEVPAGVDSLIATTPGTLGRSRVRIVGNAAEYGDLVSGKLSLRVFPFAKVTIGKDVVGTTPLSPISLLEGSYTVKLEHEGKVVKKTVKVSRGSIAKLKVDMRSE